MLIHKNYSPNTTLCGRRIGLDKYIHNTSDNPLEINCPKCLGKMNMDVIYPLKLQEALNVLYKIHKAFESNIDVRGRYAHEVRAVLRHSGSLINIDIDK